MFAVWGAPLIIIDGIPRSTEEFQRLNAMDIDDISVLKDASAAIYGVRAANGVVLVTTKKRRSRKNGILLQRFLHFPATFTYA